MENVNLRDDGFSSEEKWYALTHNQLSIGQSNDLGVDVSQVISTGSTVVLAKDGDSATVAFAFFSHQKHPEEMLAQS